MNGWSLYWRYAGVSWRAQLQYRASFVMQTIGTGLISVIEFVGIAALFARFGTIGGWALAEIAVFYGLVNVAWSIAEGIARGFDDFGALVRSGDFDRVLLRPRSTVLQVLGREMTLRRVGRLLQGASVLTWGWTSLGLGASPEKFALAGLALAGAIALFDALLIMQATLAFWTIESLEIMNTLTYGGVTTAQYPLTIYPAWLRRFFLFVVPLGAVAYFPIVAILDKPDPLGTTRLIQWVSPLAGFVFLLIALRVWHFGVRRYTSTGS